MATPLPGGRATASFASAAADRLLRHGHEKKSQGPSKDSQNLAELLSKSTLTRPVRFREWYADVLASMGQS